jgi:hypothetical protein
LNQCQRGPVQLSAGEIQPDTADVFWACGLLKSKILSVHEKESTPVLPLVEGKTLSGLSHFMKE